MSKSLHKLSEKFQEIDTNHLQLIRGGGGPYAALTTAQINQLFDFSQMAGGAQNGIALKFIDEMTKFYTTDIGHSLIDTMIADCTVPISVSNTSPSDPNLFAQYDRGSNTIEIGNLVNTIFSSNSAVQAAAFGASVHEFYHAFQNLVLGQSSGPINIELDAYLFEGEAALQYDALNTATHSSFYKDRIGQLLSQSANAGNFAADFNAILTNPGSFTLANYNTLISQFKNSAYDPNGVYDAHTFNPVTNITSIQLNQLLYNHSGNVITFTTNTTTPAHVPPAPPQKTIINPEIPYDPTNPTDPNDYDPEALEQYLQDVYNYLYWANNGAAGPDSPDNSVPDPTGTWMPDPDNPGGMIDQAGNVVQLPPAMSETIIDNGSLTQLTDAQLAAISAQVTAVFESENNGAQGWYDHFGEDDQPVWMPDNEDFKGDVIPSADQGGNSFSNSNDVSYSNSSPGSYSGGDPGSYGGGGNSYDSYC